MAAILLREYITTLRNSASTFFYSVSDNLVFLFEGHIEQTLWFFDLVLGAAIVYSALRGSLLPLQVQLILPNPFTWTFILIPFSLLSEDPKCRKVLTRWDKMTFHIGKLWVFLPPVYIVRRESNVFTGVCLSGHMRRGYPNLWSQVPSLSSGPRSFPGRQIRRRVHSLWSQVLFWGGNCGVGWGGVIP